MLTRHPKANGKDGIEEQVRRECELRGLPLLELTVLGEVDEPYITQRGPRQRPPGPGWRMELRFATEVDGPLCLGASSHFGMGRFRPVGSFGFRPR